MKKYQQLQSISDRPCEGDASQDLFEPGASELTSKHKADRLGKTVGFAVESIDSANLMDIVV